MAKDIVQATNNKGVAGWSLKTDDNATVDPTINWQEGQAPSTVNNSARAMMTRIREEHDLIDNRVKEIENGWGSKFLYVKSIGYTLKGSVDGKYDLNMVISDKLTDAQYADFKAGKLLLVVDSSNDTLKDSVYKSLTTIYTIGLSLSIPTASTTHLWQVNIGINFFGSRYETNRITLHELPYILNNLMEYVVEKADPSSSSMRAVRSIPMNRSYITAVTTSAQDRGGKDVILSLSWYYISPREIILTVEPSGANSYTNYNIFTHDLGFGWDNLTFLDVATQEMSGFITKESPPRFGIVSNNFSNLPDKWDGVRYRFLATLTKDAQFESYPMTKIPEPGKTYPIIT